MDCRFNYYRNTAHNPIILQPLIGVTVYIVSAKWEQSVLNAHAWYANKFSYKIQRFKKFIIGDLFINIRQILFMFYWVSYGH